MKNVLSLPIMLLILISCGHDQGILHQMEQIKSEGNTNPQLAMRMLDSIQTDVRQSDEYIQMKYDLLNIRLHDKAYIKPTSDLTIKRLTGYFDENGTNMERQEVHYYAGSVYRDLDDTPRALENFLASENLCHSSEPIDSLMLLNTYSNLHWLYYCVQDYKNALCMAKKECKIGIELKILDTRALIHLASTYLRIDSLSAAKETLYKAYSLYRHEKNNNSEEILSSLLYSFSSLGMRAEAQKCYLDFVNMRKIDSSKSDYNLALGEYYKLTDKPDSSIKCYQRILSDSSDITGMYDASRALFLLYQKTGNPALANLYAGMFVHISDSLNLGERQLLAATVNNAYQYHRNMREEQESKDAKTKYQSLSIGIVLLFTILTLSLITFLVHIKNKKLKELLFKTDELRCAKEIGKQLKDEILKQESELDVVKLALKNTNDELQSINTQLETKNKELQEKENELEQKLEQNRQLVRLLHHSDLESNAENIIEDIKKAAEGKYMMKAQDWKQFYQAVDKLYPSLQKELAQQFGTLEEQCIQVCYLLHAGFSNSQIQNLIPRSRVTIWRWIKKYKLSDKFSEAQRPDCSQR